MNKLTNIIFEIEIESGKDKGKVLVGLKEPETDQEIWDHGKWLKQNHNKIVKDYGKLSEIKEDQAKDLGFKGGKIAFSTAKSELIKRVCKEFTSIELLTKKEMIENILLVLIDNIEDE